MVSRDMELEVRKRALKLTRMVEVEGARFFRSVERFCAELVEDATEGGVKCRNWERGDLLRPHRRERSCRGER